MSKYILANPLVQDRRGNVAPTFALMSLVAFGVVGAAIDFGRAFSMRSHVQQALDAAIVAGVAKIREGGNEAAAKAMAEAIFSAHFPNALMKLPPNQSPSQTPGYNQPLVDINVSGGNVTGTATVTVDTPILAVILGQNALVSGNATGIPPAGKKIELAMMIDLTGSMGATRNGQTKIAGLKIAADDLLNILLPDSGVNNDAVRIAIAPFADYVNAGSYAAAVTGLPATGSYENLTNLTSTRQTTFRGSYTGLTGNSAGSQAGAVSAQSGSQTYTSGHCANPGAPAVAQLPYPQSQGGYPVGYYLHDGVQDGQMAQAPSQLKGGSTSVNYYAVTRYDNSGSQQGWEYGTNDAALWSNNSDSVDGGYYIPIPQDPSLVTYLRDNNIIVGVPFAIDDANGTIPPQIKRASDFPGGYKKITGFANGQFTYQSTLMTTGFFLPVPESMNGGTLPQCTTTAQPQGELVSCVTERTGSQAYTDASPGNGQWMGAFNHGNSATKNYSQDGKCYVAGRELPAIKPLTNDKAAMKGFFANATVGGATPGHIGTAWAWNLISPNWNSVWNLSEPISQYNDDKVIKAAILMTDGEYNIHYSTPTARDQALAICSNMRAAGIKVYAVGFGFAQGTTRTTNTAEGKAMDLLMECTGNKQGTYFFPYDGEALRQDFSEIASSLIADSNGNVARITN